jgi:energy-coupling factor transport system permease protein
MPFEFEVKETWLHRTNPSLKLILMSALMLVTLLIHNPNIQLFLTLASFLLFAAWSGWPARFTVLLTLPFLLVFVSSSMSMILFGKGSTVWFEWGWIRVSQESFYRGLHTGLRSLAFAFFGLAFSLTTRPVLLFYSLMQQLKLKPKYAYSFMAAIRLIPILLEELQTIRMAMTVRGLETKRGALHLFRRMKAYAVPLLSQSIRRAHRIAVAMEAKQFGDGERTSYYRTGFSVNDAWLAAVCLLLFLLSYAAGNAVPVWPVTDVRALD